MLIAPIALGRPTASVAFTSRTRLSTRQELVLALLPTLVVLGMLAGVEVFSRQRLLFASLASSAFLIYLDPDHPANAVRTVTIAQGAAALLGFAAFWVLGAGYLAAGTAMVLTVVLMVSADAMHPPAVSTALTFAFRASPASSLSLFGLSMVLIVLLVVLQRASSWMIHRHPRAAPAPPATDGPHAENAS
jgi:CBS-domain-containing membrane protein